MKKFQFPRFLVKRSSAKNTDMSAPVEWIIAGLGNPGRGYETTRHNVGFVTVDYISEKLGIPVKRGGFRGLYGMGSIDGVRVMLLKPQTFMNLSGECIRDAAAYYKVPSERILVIFDDISLPTGTLRIRRKGSDGGHNGIKSIIYQMKNDEFPRIKIGVGDKPHPDADLRDHVLSGFAANERDKVRDAVRDAAEAVREILANGITSAMNKFN